MAKPKIDRVIPLAGKIAIQRAKDRGSAYSEYIIAFYQATGRLAPGCDAKDLYAWMDQVYRPTEDFLKLIDAIGDERKELYTVWEIFRVEKKIEENIETGFTFCDGDTVIQDSTHKVIGEKG